MRELEASLQQFGEFILKAQLIKEKAAPYCVRWVRRFLTRPASNEPLADQVRRFREELEQSGCLDGQVIQAEQALASTSSTSSSERTGIGDRRVPWWMRRAERARWRPSNSCDRASEPGTTPIEPSAATRTGCGASSRT